MSEWWYVSEYVKLWGWGIEILVKNIPIIFSKAFSYLNSSYTTSSSVNALLTGPVFAANLLVISVKASPAKTEDVAPHQRENLIVTAITLVSPDQLVLSTRILAFLTPAKIKDFVKI